MGSRAGEVIAADRGVTAAAFLAIQEPAQQVARASVLPEARGTCIGHAIAVANGSLTRFDSLPQRVVDDT